MPKPSRRNTCAGSCERIPSGHSIGMAARVRLDIVRGMNYDVSDGIGESLCISENAIRDMEGTSIQMTYQDVLAKVDHTVLKQTTTWADIQKLCDDALRYHTASVCIPPVYVKQAAEYLGDRLPVCTVIGFPNGSNTTACKAFEVRDAVKNGAKELDMVVNIGWVKDGKYEDVLREINCLKEACDGMLLKVIIETCLLTRDEIIALCDVVSRSDADFIKTSTGFSTAGATFEDVELMCQHMTNGKKVKAAGGISGFEDGKRFLELGAQRLGTSRLVAQAKTIDDLSAEL